MTRDAFSSFDADIVVIGAGVVGLAVAAELAQLGREVIVLEKNGAIGEETSSRNSEVIHAGLYYPAGSLKGRFCVRGRDLLYDWARARNVKHRQCGKLIVATTPDEEPALESVLATAEGNGVSELHLIDRDEARAMEPALEAAAALWSPLTGVVDSHGLMLSLQGAAEDHGAAIAFETTVEAGAALPSGGVELVTGGTAPARITARTVINAAGLWAPMIARSIEGPHLPSAPKAFFSKGNYFSLSGTHAPFTRLIYPAPVEGGLGVHLTLDLAGSARFGPDVEPLDVDDPAQIDYEVDPKRAEAFYAAIRRYWPGLPDGALHPDYAGVRPKIAEDRTADFRIDGPAEHGAAGLYHLYGFESPALTGALAVAEEIARRIAEER